MNSTFPGNFSKEWEHDYDFVLPTNPGNLSFLYTKGKYGHYEID